MQLIEYNFLFFPDVPYVTDKKADFWFYHDPGFAYFGIFILSFLLLFLSLITIYRANSNFFYSALFLSITLITSTLYLNPTFFYFL